MGALTSIVYKPQEAEPVADGYTRVPLREARLVVGGGIEGDLKGAAMTRQLNIMTAEKVQDLAAEGFSAAPGQLGEQLLVAGVDVDTLPVGTCLQIGTSACVEVMEPRTGCGKFERYQGKLRTLAAGRMGVMARVITEGDIRVGDPVHVKGAD